LPNSLLLPLQNYTLALPVKMLFWKKGLKNAEVERGIPFSFPRGSLPSSVPSSLEMDQKGELR
jgi:hypothetical protein